MKPEHQEGIVKFTDTFESVVIGLQIQDAALPTITASQYAVMLAGALYAAQITLASPLLPAPETQADYTAFINAAADHYAERMAEAATELARQFIEKMGGQ